MATIESISLWAKGIICKNEKKAHYQIRWPPKFKDGTLLQGTREGGGGGKKIPTSLEQNHLDFRLTEYISKFFK